MLNISLVNSLDKPCQKVLLNLRAITVIKKNLKEIEIIDMTVLSGRSRWSGSQAEIATMNNDDNLAETVKSKAESKKVPNPSQKS